MTRTNFILIVLAILVANSSGFYLPEVSPVALPPPPLINGTAYIFRSFMDNSAVTVHQDGEVTTEEFINSPEQWWTIITHPFADNALEFVQEVVPYNTLSGYEDPPDNPGTFPRPLGLANRGKLDKFDSWNIVIRGRWCIQANGIGYVMEMDDCEDFVAPWQLWRLEEVS